jgi:hypothetical protein
MTDTKDFPTLDALSALTGSLVSPAGIGAVYEVLNFMTGESVYTHQIPRISREAQAFMCKRLPDLVATCQEAAQVTPENYREWQARWLARHGDTITVARMGIEDHEPIDPLSELAEKVPPERRIVLRLP